MASIIQDSLFINGTLQAQNLVLPANAVTDANISGAAAIATAKMIHRYRLVHRAATISNPGTGTYPLHACESVGGGILNSIAFGAVGVDSGAGHNSSIVFDLLNNGSSLLSSPFALLANTFTPPNYANSTSYTQGQVVKDVASGNYYYCKAGHTSSGANVAADSPSTNWTQVQIAQPTARSLTFAALNTSTLHLNDWLDLSIIYAYAGSGAIPTGFYLVVDVDEAPA